MLLDLNSEFYASVRGGIFALFLYHIIFYFQNRNKLYLQFSHTLLVVWLFLMVQASIFTTINKYLFFSLQLVFAATLISLTRSLLNTRIKLPIIDGWAVVLTKLFFVLAIVTPFIECFFKISMYVVLKTIGATLYVIYPVFYYYLIKKVGDKKSWWFVVGSIFYLLISTFTFWSKLIGKDFFGTYELHYMFFYYTAKVVLFLLFSVLIGYTVSEAEKKRKSIEIKLANNLKQMEELKMRALQSQMNPHFLFNSLNSINNFILKNDVEKASDYITKFSKLIRAILNSSSNTTISLKEELDILELYIKLEQIRVSGGFDYILNVDKSLQINKIKVPPLFLQPFIENAIWHGIMKTKLAHKYVEINLKKEKDFMICTITDNGIGVSNSLGSQKTAINDRRKFHGSEATKNRIEILYQSKDVKVLTKDISTNNKTGTQVYIKIPIKGHISTYLQ